MKQPRQVAAETLIAVYSGGQAQEVLARNLEALPKGERQFCSDLVYGVLRSRIRIAHIFGHFLAKPAKLPPLMQALLETAAYSFLFQDGAPAYAVLNESVELVKRHHGQKLANVANGVLRALLRELPQLKALTWYGKNADPIYYAMPCAITRLWQAAYGKENLQRLLVRSFGRPWTGVRVNPAHEQATAVLRALREVPDTVEIGKWGAAFPPGRLPAEIMGKPVQDLERAGVLSFQAAGSQLVLEKLGLPEVWEHAQIWDACAGSGGKTAFFLERGASVVLASDVSKRRLARLPRECARLGLPVPALVYADLALPPVSVWQGNIMIDAPCSGLGVLARRPDIKLRFDAQQNERQVALQRALLARACSIIAPGCEVAYITCTLNPAENQNQIANVAVNGMEVVAEWETPQEHPWLEGMYGARLRKVA